MITKEKILKAIDQQISNMYCGIVDMDINKELPKDIKEIKEEELKELKEIRQKLEKLLI